MHEPLNNLTIGTFARAAGVNVETIRFYQRRGLLEEPNRPYGGIRRYHSGDVERVRFIKSAQRLGFNLNEVGELLLMNDGAHCDDTRLLAEQKLADVRRRMADLQRMETTLSALVEQCCNASSDVRCPLIASLQRDP